MPLRPAGRPPPAARVSRDIVIFTAVCEQQPGGPSGGSRLAAISTYYAHMASAARLLYLIRFRVRGANSTTKTSTDMSRTLGRHPLLILYIYRYIVCHVSCVHHSRSQSDEDRIGENVVCGGMALQLHAKLILPLHY